ncbi:MAG TPA: MarR family transcriptional regulator [Bacillota bacterium]
MPKPRPTRVSVEPAGHRRRELPADLGWRLQESLATLPDSVVPLLQAAASLAARRDESFLRLAHGLTAAQYQFLLEVHKSGEATLTTVARRLGCTKGNVTGLAVRLERDGYLNRERSPVDRRVTRVRLTEKGQKVWEVREALSREHDRLANSLGRDDRARLAALLRKLLSALALSDGLEARPKP